MKNKSIILAKQGPSKIRPNVHCETKKIGILCVGHPYMGDDGIGPVIAERLTAPTFSQNIEVIDIGTAGAVLLHHLARFDAAIIVDACDFGGKTGQIALFSADDDTMMQQVNFSSTHDGDIPNLIRLSRSLGECPGFLAILAIQPGKIEPGTGISLRLRGQIGRIVRRLECEIERIEESLTRNIPPHHEMRKGLGIKRKKPRHAQTSQKSV